MPLVNAIGWISTRSTETRLNPSPRFDPVLQTLGGQRVILRVVARLQLYPAGNLAVEKGS